MSRTEHEEKMFQHYCRRPGTRINDIMVLIESGFSDEEIADMVGHKNSKGQSNTKAYDIAVCRKALNGELCRLTVWEQQANVRLAREERDRKILELYAQGHKAEELADMFGVTEARIYHITSAAGWNGHRSKKGVKLV